jgi:hypothetical protein
MIWKAWIEDKNPRFSYYMDIPDIVVMGSGVKTLISPSAPRAHF